MKYLVGAGKELGRQTLPAAIPKFSVMTLAISRVKPLNKNPLSSKRCKHSHSTPCEAGLRRILGPLAVAFRLAQLPTESYFSSWKTNQSAAETPSFIGLTREA